MILVIDGPRYSETWGDTSKQYIPYQKQIAEQGTVFTSFYNDGTTNTVNGHAAITTGTYEALDNTGAEIPVYPSIFQIWRNKTSSDSTKAWVVTTKDKLEVLSNCSQAEYANKYRPLTDCGVNGLATGYRDDSTTLSHALNVLKTYSPDVMLIQFKEPDASGHAANWNAYLNGISTTDRYAWRIFNFINDNKNYRGKTAFFITNDHGRHLDGVLDGFVSHGCSCNGCRHINLIAIGPDFKKGATITNHYGQIDLTKTIADILNITMPNSSGQAISELFAE